MKRTIAILITLGAFVNCLIGCTSPTLMPRDELLQSRGDHDMILDARLFSDSIVSFNRSTVRLDSTARTVTGRSRWDVPVELKYDEISAFSVQRRDNAETVLIVLGIGVGIMLLGAAMMKPMEFDLDGWEEK
ncbi:MAG: hypothetical protein ABIF77_17930 [bacterium]